MSTTAPEEYKIQGYLLANAEELIKLTGRNLPKRRAVSSNQKINNMSKGQRFAAQQPVYVKKVARDPTAAGDNFSDLFNSFNPVGSIEFVDDLPDAARRKLTPTFRVFKTLKQHGTGKEVDLELKSGVLEKLWASTAAGTAVQDVEILRLGGNPEEVDTNIKVSITLYSTHLGHLFAKQTPAPLPNWKTSKESPIPAEWKEVIESGVSWIDLIKMDLGETAEEEAISHQYVRAIGKESKSSVMGGEKSHLEMDEISQRIKIELGYKRIKKLAEYTPEEVEKINNWLSSQTEVLYLSLLEHEIAFNEDGTSTMRINYIASGGTNTFSRHDDILFEPYFYELEKRWNDDICKLNKLSPNKEGGVGLGSYVLTDNPFHSSKLKSWDAKDVERRKDLIEERERWIEEIRTAQSQLMLSGLYGWVKYFSDVETHSLASSHWRETQYLSRVKCTKILLKDTLKITSKLSRNENGQPFGVENYLDRFWRKSKENRKEWKKYHDDLSGEVDEMAVFSDLQNTGGNPAVISQFVFLGDIIETAIEVLASNRRFGYSESVESKYAKRSPRFKVWHKGDSSKVVENAFILPLNNLFLRGRNVKEFSTQTSKMSHDVPSFVRQGDWIMNRIYEEYGEILFSDITYQNPGNPNEDITINLADLPISLFDYKRWYIENFVAKRRSTLYLKQFIEMLISNYVPNLIAKARRKAGETTDKEKPVLLINRETLAVPVRGFLQHSNTERNEPLNALSRNRLRKIFKKNQPQALTNSATKLQQITIISQASVVNIKPPPNQTRRQLNKAKNIPNIVFNSKATGILDTLSFQKEDMPGLREARLFEGKNFVGPDIIREKYNCSLRMKGTTFFKPGNVLYLDPSPLDLGFAVDGKSPARLLGLGGSYDVLRVTHNINLSGDNTWETDLETKWTSFGENDGLRKRKMESCQTSYKARLENSLDLSDPKVVMSLYSPANLAKHYFFKPKP